MAPSRPLLRLVCPRRARLYRVVGAEWKQRGTGDIKILKHKTTGRFRVVMRQEKTLKLVANHRFDTASTLVRAELSHRCSYSSVVFGNGLYS